MLFTKSLLNRTAASKKLHIWENWSDLCKLFLLSDLEDKVIFDEGNINIQTDPRQPLAEAQDEEVKGSKARSTSGPINCDWPSQNVGLPRGEILRDKEEVLGG